MNYLVKLVNGQWRQNKCISFIVVCFGAASAGFSLATVAYVASFLFWVWVAFTILAGCCGAKFWFIDRQQEVAQTWFTYGLLYLIAAAISWLIKNAGTALIIGALILVLLGDLPTWRKFLRHQHHLLYWWDYACEVIIIACSGVGAFAGLEFCLRADRWMVVLLCLGIIILTANYIHQETSTNPDQSVGAISADTPDAQLDHIC